MASDGTTREWGQCLSGHIFSFTGSPECRACINEQIEEIRKGHQFMCEWPDPDEIDKPCDCAERVQTLEIKYKSLEGDWRLESTVAAEMATMYASDAR